MWGKISKFLGVDIRNIHDLEEWKNSPFTGKIVDTEVWDPTENDVYMFDIELPVEITKKTLDALGNLLDQLLPKGGEK